MARERQTQCRIVCKYVLLERVSNLQMSIKGLNMIGPHYVCVLYVATAGLQGSLMGSDEQEIVLLIYVVVDVVSNKVGR